MRSRAFRVALVALGMLLVVLSARAQAPAKKGGLEGISLDLPSPDQLFRVQSEAELRNEIRADGMARGVKNVEFPLDYQEAPIMAELGPNPDPIFATLPLARVCYRTLYFQEIRTERYLRSCGPVQPLCSALDFYARTLTLPIWLPLVPPWRYHCWNYPFLP